MLTEPIRELLQEVAQNEHAEMSVGQTGIVEINNVVSAAATMYEKLRYLIDYREEHTIRRAAIERILKRHILIEKKAVSGTTLLQELVESRYVPKAAATDHFVKYIDQSIERFLTLHSLAGGSKDLAKKLVSFAASEIEASLSHEGYVIDRASVDALYKTVRPQIDMEGFSSEHIDAQVFIASRRALLASDDASLSYALWRMYVPNWRKDDLNLADIAPKTQAICNEIDRAVLHPLQWQIAQRIKNESIYFRILREAIIEKGSEASSIITNEKKLDDFTLDFLTKKYEKENAKIKSSGVRAVGYLFLTKMIIALIIEAPYEIFFLGGINYVPLLTNLLFHPTLLFALTRRVRSLDEANTKAIMSGLHEVVYKGENHRIRIYGKYTTFTRMFAVMYFVLLLGIFGTLLTFLQLAQFNAVGAALFLFFLALVSYFSYRIRSNARRWRVSGQETTLAIIGNILSVPVIRAGRWLSQTFSSINVLVVVMDFLIETPFRLILNFSHQFILYIKEKGDEVY